ncbi:MAG: sensor histidine kinase [Gammaproteobacteria bacterium]|nr:sensor histidine kinase [Gammaproteobacteria bacterium]
MYSLKNKIGRNLTVNMIAVMSLLLIVMYFFMQQLLQDYVLTRLRHDAESLISVLEKDAAQGWRVTPGRMSTVYNRVRSGHYYQIIIANQVITSRSLFDTKFPSIASDVTAADHSLVLELGAETWLLWVQRVSKHGQSIEIRMVEDIEPIQQQLLEYTVLALVLVLLVTAILTYLQQRTISQAFFVFEWLRQNLSSIRQRETRHAGIALPLEIAPLIVEIENLVEHLQQRIDRTRHAIGNLAHELKRPVQLLTLQQEERGEKLEPLQEIKKTIERELKRARISGASSAKGSLQLADEMPYMITVLQRIYPHIEVKLVVDSKPVSTPIDRDDFFELTGNLLDNACKFANNKVVISLAEDDRGVIINIEDDGTGLDLTQVAAMQHRGVRLDENIEGHGLGLGICRDIIDSYHGKLTFTKSTLGGLSVHVEIPLKNQINYRV